MSDITLDGLLDMGERHARDILLRRGEKSIAPFFHLVGPPGEDDRLVGAWWTNDAEKEATAEAVARLARDMQARAVMFVSEAWVVALTRSESRKAFEDGYVLAPAHDPRRIEVVALTARDDQGKTVARDLIMERDAKGKIIALEPLEKGETDARMLNVIIP